MEKEIKSRDLKIQGWIDIDRELQIGKSYIIGIPVVCRKVGVSDNDDHSLRQEIIVRVDGSGTIKEFGGNRSVAIKGKGSQSQVLRWEIQRKWEEDGGIGDVEEYYKNYMTRIIDAVKGKK